MASSCCGSLRPRPVIVEELDENGPLILSAPFISSLIFVNEASDARDHCANERTFLSWLRLSVYMTVVSVAIVLSFHLKSEPTSAERRMAYPLGIVFWFLSLLCLFAGLANYLRTSDDTVEKPPSSNPA
ncbi:hypothetical protein RUND412_003012 [Rhizina undulata]